MRVTVEVSDECVEGALYGAFDSGGIRSWGSVVGWTTRGRDIPTEPMHGGWIRIVAREPGDFHAVTLTTRKLRVGLQLMAEHSPARFAELVSGQYDANVGDVLVQYAVFGKVVFG